MVSNILKVGDVIGFSGAYFGSDMINLLTYGVPRWCLSHVGVIGRKASGELVMFESNQNTGTSCVITGCEVDGVQAHTLPAMLDTYKGRVWRYPLYRSLYPHESVRLSKVLRKRIGTPYDWDGAKEAAGLFYSVTQAVIRNQDITSLFCSELVAFALSEIGIFHTSNVSRWSPNKLVRNMRRDGLLDNPVRLK